MAQVGDYPFCTIEPNTSEVEIRDANIDKLAAFYRSEKIIYPKIRIVDIAGLIKGASNGLGLGNKFLSHIQSVDLIIHVVGIFNTDNFNRTHDEALMNVNVINEELILADIVTCRNYLDNRKNKLKKAGEHISLIEKAIKSLNEEKMLLDAKFTAAELRIMQKMGLITAKPMLYLFNLEENSAIPASLAKFVPSVAIYPNANESNIDQFLITAYSKLDLITFYTAGPKESRGWKICKSTTAKDAAGVIHTDLSNKFIAAEISSVDDILDGRKSKMQGKNYLIQNEDVCYFKVGR